MGREEKRRDRGGKEVCFFGFLSLYCRNLCKIFVVLLLFFQKKKKKNGNNFLFLPVVMTLETEE